ncbi:MAG: hypothetical protein HY319_26025 [Armatimonadetes bacterium]|nr:hypothetical protein [Armatimonadota bacterium]
MARTAGAEKKPPGDGRSLKNLARTAEKSREIRSEVIRPLRSSVTLATLTDRAPMTTRLDGLSFGLGVAGGALGGVVALNDFAKGVKDRDEQQIMSAAADAAVSAALLGALGVVGGAQTLATVGAVLMGARAVHRLRKNDRDNRLGGLSDLVTGGVCLSRALEAPLGLTAGLAVATAAVGMLRGLHHIARGHRRADPRLRIRGVSGMVACTGASLIATGLAPFPLNLAMFPGVGLLIGGLALPVLQRVPSWRPDVNVLVNQTSRMLYSTAVRSDHTINLVHDKLQPWVSPLAQKLDPLFEPDYPVFAPLNRAGEKACEFLMDWSRAGLDWLSHTPPARLADRVAGAIRDHLLPADTEASARSQAVAFSSFSWRPS